MRNLYKVPFVLYMKLQPQILKKSNIIMVDVPESVGDFFLFQTQISSLEGCPKNILGNLTCQ